MSCANLQDLPDVLLAHALAFLPPDTDRPLRTECAAVVVSQVSKSLRILALSNTIWVGICITRWKTKVGFVTRLANTEAEAKKDTAIRPLPSLAGPSVIASCPFSEGSLGRHLHDKPTGGRGAVLH